MAEEHGVIQERQFATFYIDKMLFGIDVHRVQEIIRYQEMTKVPLAPETIRGLINLRGQIITAVDLRTRLGLPEGKNLPMNVVVHADDGIVSLLVDKIGDVLEVNETQFEKTPETLMGTVKELIGGVYKLQGQLLLVLDQEKAVQVDVH